MHLLFTHQNSPAQFGQIADHLVRQHGWRCTFAARTGPELPGIERIYYEPKGGARQETNFCSRTFENQVWHSTALYEALKSRPDIRPDLVVGHSGMVSTLYLRELYDCPVINYFEFFYRTHGSDMDFRQDLPLPDQAARRRAQTRNAMLLLDLHNCDAGYAPTRFQWSQLPVEFQSKVQTIFDGIDVNFWRPIEHPPRRIGKITIPENHRVVTYVSRGLESMRGFDIFLKAADLVCRRRHDVTFLVIGEDRIAYGGDARFTGGKTFKGWVLSQNRFDLSRIHFVGRVRPTELVNVFSLSDAHLYLTVPFTLSWSLFNALSCGALVIGSDTAPVRELIRDGENGLLSDFFDVDAWVEKILSVLEHPQDQTELRLAARETIVENYSLPTCLNAMLQLYRDVGLAG